MLLISLLVNLEVTSSLRFCLFLHCLMMAKSFLWWFLTHRFPSSVFCEVQLSLVAIMLLISPLTNLGVTSFLRFWLFVYCFMMTKSILWWLLTHRFWSFSICEGQLPLDTIYAPDSTFKESRSYFIVELLSLSTLFDEGKILFLMVTDPSLFEIFRLRRSASAFQHVYSCFHC